MPISDEYVVQFLLQETCRHAAPLLWQETESEGYTARLHGILVELCKIQGRGGARVVLTLFSYPDEFRVTEPVNKGLFRPKYESSEQAHLANLMHQLVTVVELQCAERARRTRAARDVIRESVYRRLVGLDRPEAIESEPLEESFN
jgi:hypothetical protein